MGDYAADGSGHQNDLSGYHPSGRHTAANRTWSYSADTGDGYRVHADQLRQIASAMEQDLRDLQQALQKVTGTDPITTQHVGTTAAGTEFVSLAQNAMNGFSQYYSELQTGYRTVISNLYSSIGDYKKAEEYSTSAVASADVGSGSPGHGPTTDSTGSFSG